VVKIIGVFIGNLFGIGAHKGVMNKKQWPAIIYTHGKFYTIIMITVLIMTSLVGFAPVHPISFTDRIGIGPSGIIHFSRDGKFWSTNGHKVGNHRFIPSDQPVIDFPMPVGRPMPVKEFTIRSLFKPAPFNFFPNFI